MLDAGYDKHSILLAVVVLTVTGILERGTTTTSLEPHYNVFDAVNFWQWDMLLFVGVSHTRFLKRRFRGVLYGAVQTRATVP